MLTFVEQRIRQLLQVAGAVEPAIQLQENRQPTAHQTRLHALIAGLNAPPSAARIRSTLDALHQETSVSVTEDPEEGAYVEAIQCRILIGLYGNAMQILLDEAIEVDDAAQWWWRVEKSKRNSAWFMVQSVFHLSLNFGETNALRVLSLSSENIRPYVYYNSKFTQAQHSNIVLFMLSILIPPTLPSLIAAIGTHYICIPSPF